MQQRLPALFQEIVEADKRDPRQEPVVSLADFKDWKDRRMVLRRGAERYFKKTKGNHD